MSEQQKSKHVFFFHEETCECPYYCGPLSDREGTLKAIGHMLAPAFEELQRTAALIEGALTEVVLEVREMTDSELNEMLEDS